MTKHERLHRQDPKRSEPIRNMTAYLRNSQSWGEVPPDEEHDRLNEGDKTSETLDDVLTHGVNLGYKIIDDHILQGRRVAEDLRNRSRFRSDHRGGGGANGEFHALISRLRGLTQDMGSLCFDSLELAVKSPLLLDGRHHESAETAAPSIAESNISIEIASSRRAQVSLNLPSRQRPYSPQVHALHAANPAFQPLTGVRFQQAVGSRAPVLLVEIPDGQPASTYTGVVVERETNEPVGTLVIRVLA